MPGSLWAFTPCKSNFYTSSPCQRTEVFPTSGSDGSHPFSWPSVSSHGDSVSFWKPHVTCLPFIPSGALTCHLPQPAWVSPQPVSLHSGVLPPRWSRALLGPHFAQCFLLKHKHYECRDLPTGSESSYFHPNNRQQSWCEVHSCPLGSSQCAWTWQDLAVFKKCKHEEERLSSIASALTACFFAFQRARRLSSTPCSKLETRRRQMSCPLTDKKLTLRRSDLCKFIVEWHKGLTEAFLSWNVTFCKEELGGLLSRIATPLKKKETRGTTNKYNQMNNNIKKNKT